jgi:hypothetical protein
MTGLDRFPEKARRAQRRQYQRNHIAQDLRTPKYRERVVEPKRKQDVRYDLTDDFEDDEDDSFIS